MPSLSRLLALDMARLRRPGLAESVLVLLALLCVVIPQWRSVSSHEVRRRAEVKSQLAGALQLAESKLLALPEGAPLKSYQQGEVTIRYYEASGRWIDPDNSCAWSTFSSASTIESGYELEGFNECLDRPVVAAWNSRAGPNIGIFAEVPRSQAYSSSTSLSAATVATTAIAALCIVALVMAQLSSVGGLPSSRRRGNAAAWGILAVSLAATAAVWLSMRDRFNISPDQSVTLGQDYPTQVLLAGLAISVLLFDIALVLSSTRARALGLAELMTARHRESEARIRAVIDQAPDGIVTLDSSGRIETFNPGAENLFGYSKEQAVQLVLSRLLPACTPLAMPNLVGRGGAECKARRKDGSIFPAELTLSRIELDDRVRYTAIIRDASARKQAEEELRESQERFALAAQGANDGLWDWNLKTDEVYYSPRWKAMIGEEAGDITGEPADWLDRIHPDDLETFCSGMSDHIGGSTAHFEVEYRIRHSGGEHFWMLTRGLAVRDQEGKATRIAGSQTDITSRKQNEWRLLQQALHDPLTGLHNRSYFLSELERVRREAAVEGGRLFGLLFLDLDRFKLVNDSLGHVVGDQLLVKIAEQLRECVRPGDIICRLGGDEFALLVDDLKDAEDATRLARRIQQKLEEPLRVGKQEVFTAVSIGIALSSDGRRTPEEMLRDADTAMYRAKAGGRARYEIFDQGMHTQAVRQLKIENDLRRAVEREELIVHYQPIVRLTDGCVVSCEALMRWQHPGRGLLQPSEFIGVAEETGSISSLTEWLLEMVCLQSVAWEAEGLPPVRIAINVSPRQLLSPGFEDLVFAAARRHKVPLSALQLEFTESAFLETTDTAKETLSALSAGGVRISLDDFGTGYSSLVYLHRFPLDVIKIDRSFIGRIPGDHDSAAIAGGLIALAHSLNLEVVAEGVESPAQLVFLIEHHCDLAQGYALGRPAEAEVFAPALASGVNINQVLTGPETLSLHA